MSEIRYHDPVLCYVEDGLAFFTTRQLDKQWGDDWNDVPYEHNAGYPYDYIEQRMCEPYTITIMPYLSGLFNTPSHGRLNSLYSVEMINREEVAWLVHRDNAVEPIFAGTPLPVFHQIMLDLLKPVEW